jgi:peptidoglycan hydrolase CwlO-like protein
MDEKLTQIALAVARIEEKLDNQKERIDSHEGKISTLEKKIWTTLGAISMSAFAFIKSLLS